MQGLYINIFPLLTKFLLTTFIGLFVLHLACQFSRASIYNPIVYFVVRVTNVFIVPVKAFLPSFRYIDTAVLLLTMLAAMFSYSLYFFIYYGVLVNITALLFWSLISIVKLMLDIYFWATLITVLLSWISPLGNHPFPDLARQLVAKPTSYIAKWVPNLGGLDFSPMVFILALSLLDKFINGLAMSFQVPIIFSLGL